MATIIAESARVSPLADIEESTRGTHFKIGPRSVIDSYVKVKMVGGTGSILIGESSTINSGCVLYSGNGIVIGNNVAVAANCVFAPVNHQYSSRDSLIIEQGFRTSRGGIIVEDDVWIGAGCILLDGAVLRKGCVIGAMSLVRGDIAGYSVQCGNPLKLIGNRR